MTTPGIMVVCDGSNGAGKTTLIHRLKEHLERQGHKVLVTREPGGTPISEQIREILLNPQTTEMCDRTELLLFGAARAQHLREKILPALEAGVIVLCDRFDSATLAFQHYARGIEKSLVDSVNHVALGDFRPDLYLILDLDPEIGLQRVKGRGDALDRLEKERLVFLERARAGFLEQARQDPKRFVVLDARVDPERIAQRAGALVDALLASRKSNEGVGLQPGAHHG